MWERSCPSRPHISQRVPRVFLILASSLLILRCLDDMLRMFIHFFSEVRIHFSIHVLIDFQSHLKGQIILREEPIRKSLFSLLVSLDEI